MEIFDLQMNHLLTIASHSQLRAAILAYSLDGPTTISSIAIEAYSGYIKNYVTVCSIIVCHTSMITDQFAQLYITVL